MTSGRTLSLSLSLIVSRQESQVAGLDSLAHQHSLLHANPFLLPPPGGSKVRDSVLD